MIGTSTAECSVELGQWYLVYAKLHHEEIAQFHLERKGIPVFFPRLFLPQPSPKRAQIVPLFPSYLFAQIWNPAEYDAIRWSPGVKWVVNADGIPAPLDERIVTFLKQCATPSGVLTTRSILLVGQQPGNHNELGKRLAALDLHDTSERIQVLMQLL